MGGIDYIDNSGSNVEIYSYGRGDEIINRAGGSNSFIDTGDGDDKLQFTAAMAMTQSQLMHLAQIITALMLMQTMLLSKFQEAIRPFNRKQALELQFKAVSLMTISQFSAMAQAVE